MKRAVVLICFAFAACSRERAVTKADPQGLKGIAAATAKQADDGQPIVLIDGQPVGTMSESDLQKMNIVSIEVIKGAASVAMYGERGMNGVISIRTKK